jgi:hypothetical protein
LPAIKYNDFIKLTKESEPSDQLTGIHLALCYAVKNNWDMAHKIVQDLKSETAFWIHAHLHRVEGDIANAHYWYNRARKKPSSGPLHTELDDIIKSLF